MFKIFLLSKPTDAELELLSRLVRPLELLLTQDYTDKMSERLFNLSPSKACFQHAQTEYFCLSMYVGSTLQEKMANTEPSLLRHDEISWEGTAGSDLRQDWDLPRQPMCSQGWTNARTCKICRYRCSFHLPLIQNSILSIAKALSIKPNTGPRERSPWRGAKEKEQAH